METIHVASAFGVVLRECRQKAGVSQEALAGIAGIDRTFVSLLERGLRQPTLCTIFELAEALQVSPSSMVSRTAALATDAAVIARKVAKMR